MRNLSVQDLLNVNWFDGLAVNAGHFIHSNNVVNSQLSIINRISADQPGLVSNMPVGHSTSQLISLVVLDVSSEEYLIDVTVTRSFAAVVPSGRIVVGCGSEEVICGIKAGPTQLKIPTNVNKMLVCVAQRASDKLIISNDNVVSNEITLVYPALSIIPIATEDYISRIEGDFSNYIPIGALSISAGDISITPDYIPPVTSLQVVGCFDEGITPNIRALCDQLLRAVTKNVEAAGVAFSQGKVSADLMSRRSDYESLRNLLFSMQGHILGIDRMSPIKLLTNIIQPVAIWWIHHFNRNYGKAKSLNSETEISRISQFASSIIQLSYSDLCAGSSFTLRTTEKFLSKLIKCLELAG